MGYWATCDFDRQHLSHPTLIFNKCSKEKPQTGPDTLRFLTIIHFDETQPLLLQIKSLTVLASVAQLAGHSPVHQVASLIPGQGHMPWLWAKYLVGGMQEAVLH